ncbi:Lsr2 family protein [Microbacterium sp. P04]|uniref:histone-like nucleoid-structuring protein Lsr2 n=1 Tax=Microbacterium sp. P04 TaxID=3366947 RepID=UPI0037469905
MVLQHITRRLDDLDGSELGDNPQPLTFALEGVQYEIDLSPDNATRLREALDPFITAARVTDEPSHRPQTRTTRSMDRKAIREWAKANNLDVSERGRISDEVLTAYENRRAS